VSGHPCPERLLLPEALSGRLDPAEEKRVMAHLQTCPACQDAAADIEVALVSLATLRVARDEADRGGPDEAEPLATALHVVSAEVQEPGPIEFAGFPAGAPVSSGGRPGDDPATAATAATAATGAPEEPTPIGRRRPVRRTLLAAAAAVVLLTCGAAVGHELLPPRDTNHYGPPVALAPPAGASRDTATGTAAIAQEGNALAVKLTASRLPAAGWYECVWTSAGEARSAGSFRATNGAVNVELRVAPPKGSTGWGLEVIAHTGAISQVVLEGNATVPS
jgi:anti-sigma factor RsiW